MRKSRKTLEANLERILRGCGAGDPDTGSGSPRQGS